MVCRVPNSDEPKPIETVSVDELRNLQFERLQCSTGHAYDNVAPYRAMCNLARLRTPKARLSASVGNASNFNDLWSLRADIFVFKMLGSRSFRT